MKCAAFLLAGGAVCAQAFMTAPLASTRTSTAARVSGLHMSATSELPTQVWYSYTYEVYISHSIDEIPDGDTVTETICY